ncbi:D-alanine--D-alanyl carrier protein ligase [Sinobacterium norvegicum]|uniref:D-alanine--D-alanyl carrier protein ligase n=1 Tax=Sinobacterium norvegicum TaxID=1641715 RepID=A0ABN8EGE7_9GAMM|nr:AMP-binding protein [Sinobacterium norvegicum]CAH0991518.1 D-alanine--D-alanyl carrier protein ligase [Sinobacterium norvegicum]
MNKIDHWLTRLLQRPVTQIIACGEQGQAVDYGQLWQLVVLLQQKKSVCAGAGAGSSASWLLSFDDNLLFLAAFLALVIDGEKPLLPVSSRQGAIDKLSGQAVGLITDQPLKHRAAITLVGSDLYALAGAGSAHAQSVLLSRLNQRGDENRAELTVFTSGSSGMPKAINKPLLFLLREVEVLEQQWGSLLGDSEIVASVSGQHIYGLLFRLLWPLTAGRVMSSHSMLYPEQVVAKAAKHRVLVASPALLSRLDESDASGQAYGTVFSSGGPLSLAASKKCGEVLRRRPIEVFGSSETGGVAWRVQQDSSSPWRCFAGISATMSEGRLLIESPFISAQQQPWQMDDLVELVGSGQFVHRGRSDSVVKIAEKRVSLLDINHHLSALAEIAQSHTAMFTLAKRDEIVAVVVLTASGQAMLESEGRYRLTRYLRQQLRHDVEPVAIPRRFRFLPRLPYNAQGKIIKQDIIKLFDHE